MAHPRRRHMVQALGRALPPSTVVVWDTKNDRWDTGRRSLMAYHPAADWHVVVQDDAVLCRDFVSHVAIALAKLAGTAGPACFFVSHTGDSMGLTPERLQAARNRGVCWLEHKGPWWGVAIATPTPAIHEMVAWCDERTDIPNYDRRQSRYWEHQGIPCRYSIPSLVDHRVGAENPSLVPGRSASRRRTAMWAPAVVPGPWTGRAMVAQIGDPTSAR